MKRVLSALLVFVLTVTFSAAAFAAPATQTTEQIFNSVTLVPRESTNPTLAKYVKTVADAIDPDGTMKGYDFVAAAHDWIVKNVTWLGKDEKGNVIPYFDNYGAGHFEGAALYGLENKKAQCENFSAVFTYLCRYKGYDAFWTYGDVGPAYPYHWWTEIVIGDDIFAFDEYPSMVMSFQHRTSTVKGKTTIGGFPWLGYFYSWERSKDGKDLISVADKGVMSGMKEITTTTAPVDPNAPKTMYFTKSYTDGITPSFTWQLPTVGEEKVTMASISGFYESTESQAMQDAKKLRFGGIANKTLTAYKVKAGTWIDAGGSSALLIAKLRLANGKLQVAGATPINWGKEVAEDWSHEKRVDLGGGSSYPISQKGDGISVQQEGYYLVELSPWNKYCFDTNPKSSSFTHPLDSSYFRYGYAVIHVVK